jgi:hypothetical protein
MKTATTSSSVIAGVQKWNEIHTKRKRRKPTCPYKIPLYKHFYIK